MHTMSFAHWNVTLPRDKQQVKQTAADGRIEAASAEKGLLSDCLLPVPWQRQVLMPRALCVLPISLQARMLSAWLAADTLAAWISSTPRVHDLLGTASK